MIEWRERGLVLSVRRLGESDAVLEALTRDHGRHAGVVRGGGGRRMAPLLQPGAELDLAWRARLEDHLGHFTVEPLRSRAALMTDADALAGMAAVCALLGFALPERDAQPGLFEASIALLDLMEEGPGWAAGYLRWEMALLDRMGFGLDLSACAVSGAREDLAFVSPRTGRAVARGAAGAWADRLLPLPAILLGQPPRGHDEIVQGLRVTGHFLDRRLAAAQGDRPLPAARDRLVARLTRGGQGAGGGR
ncbi:DNA repair protein RecO [Palleronia sediminis]|uniref:DNA repair protein RecO n=1 Tax=Palleronia sediminis TaxID=2547833 RepID=A0A4R6AEF5_9RHOB|nr:DNA repair protein RecO [Palleronia sediminis]TDL79856.1 DNA repair protein RecO [Palleronia sediminis]